MAQLFEKPAPTSQSPAKTVHHLSVKNPFRGNDTDQDMDDTLLFATLDDSHGQHSEDSGINMSNTSDDREVSGEVLPGEETQTTPSFALGSRIEDIGKKAQDLIERINQRRAMDQEIMTSFETKLMNKVSEVCQQVKEQMFSSYEEHGGGMEAGLQELSQVLERSSQLSAELQGASQTLSAINMGLQQTPGQ